MTGNRLLVATAVAHYSKAPRWDRPGLVAAREEIIRLFTGTFGHTHLSDLGLNPTPGCRRGRRRSGAIIPGRADRE
jgi:hypothetical protein